MLLELSKLTIAVEGKPIVSDLYLNIKDGEVHVIMGPNGSGKSTVCYGIMGHPKYRTTGSIKFEGEEISGMSTDKRANRGMFLAFQNPQAIPGVNVTNILRKARAAVGDSGNGADRIERMVKVNEEVTGAISGLGLPQEFSKRELNVGSSGGEKKRMELLQMEIIKPKLAILDEVEAGLDVDGIRLAADVIKKMQDGKRAFLIITHLAKITEYIKPDSVHVMLNGKIVKTGDHRLAKEIEKSGYEELKKVKGG